MTKRLEMKLTYDAPVEAVTAMLADPAFREAVCDLQRVLRKTVSIEPVGDGMHVTIDQVHETTGIPSFAKRFVGSETNVVQKEIWSTPELGDITVEIPGKPGNITGTARVEADGDGTVETVVLDIQVGIPLITRKVEGMLHELLSKALRAEQKVGRDYLSG